ncbi:sugar ABC transporter ATP-binding protein [Tessaracoccus caeni]|uniref:sugar ABC transporter ATP-binding protein n=1 Tax=Tessaracoccus caeni TaxID=3031239 RepID=UPI0023DB49E8|nr:sugar ABC transporter ATP-binding protein [Tessaracoccus caeni]MDF1487924.1 sugar ABC transporter ATP-binding protein [Tessaracoccus caeni]
MSHSLLEVRGISKRYGGVQALKDVSVTFGAGRVHCLAGVNGSGKSTLIKIISGVEAPDAGELTLEGHPLRHHNARLALQHGIQVIYQDLALFGNLSVAENIDMLRRSLQSGPIVGQREALQRAEAVTERLGLSLPLTTDVDDLSVADRQLTAICRALAQDAKVLFMDEPTTALTWREVDKLFEVVQRLKDDGVAIVFVSHKLDEALAISDDMTVIRNGIKVAEGLADSFTEDSLAEALVGSRTTTERKTVESPAAAEVALSVRGLGVATQFHDISFDLKAGEIVGLTGLRGSGRTQIADALFGLLPADSGEIRIFGEPVKLTSPDAAITAGVAYVPEDRLRQGVFLTRSISENLVAATIDDLSKAGVINRSRVAEQVDSSVDALQIKIGKPSDPIRTLSGGNQQKVVIGKWVATRPRILILNGPTVGVDIGAKFGILQILRTYAEEGMAILVVSDDFQEVAGVCNRVLVVDKGLLRGEVTGDDVSVEAVRELVMEVSQ